VVGSVTSVCSLPPAVGDLGAVVTDLGCRVLGGVFSTASDGESWLEVVHAAWATGEAAEGDGDDADGASRRSQRQTGGNGWEVRAGGRVRVERTWSGRGEGGCSDIRAGLSSG